MDYPVIKAIHLGCVIATFVMFFGRGVLMLVDSALLNHRVLRVLPHVNDTALLASAIALAAMSGQYPIAQGWLTAKVAGLLAYIGFGMFAFRRGTRRTRIAAWLAALAVFFYMVGVAFTRGVVPLRLE